MTSALLARLAAGHPPPRRRRWGFVLAAVSVVVIAAALIWVVAFSSVLGVATVRIKGERTVTAQQVRDASGIRSGNPLVRLDTAAIERRIERLPDIASARVAVSYPSTVLITVRERVAVGYLALDRGGVLVDVTGRQFRSVPAVPAGLPRFDVPAGSAGEAAAHAVAVVAGALPGSLRVALTSIQAGEPSAVTLNLADRRTVRWGSDERSDVKARVVVALLGRPGTVFDVSDPELAVVR